MRLRPCWSPISVGCKMSRLADSDPAHPLRHGAQGRNRLHRRRVACAREPHSQPPLPRPPRTRSGEVPPGAQNLEPPTRPDFSIAALSAGRGRIGWPPDPGAPGWRVAWTGWRAYRRLLEKQTGERDELNTLTCSELSPHVSRSLFYKALCNSEIGVWTDYKHPGTIHLQVVIKSVFVSWLFTGKPALIRSTSQPGWLLSSRQRSIASLIA